MSFSNEAVDAIRIKDWYNHFKDGQLLKAGNGLAGSKSAKFQKK